MKARALLMLAIAVGAVAACDSGDDDADPATTESTLTSSAVVTSSDPPSTTAVPSTTTSTTTTLPLTTPVPTTTSPEQVKAEVAAAYLNLDAQLVDLLMTPSLDGLDARASGIAVPGSPYYVALVNQVTTLVNNGQFMARNTPDIQSLTVESVESPKETATTQSWLRVR